MDHTLYTPLEVKQNSVTFQYCLKMPSVFKQNREIIDNKKIEYQERLKRQIEQFRRDLERYREKVKEYENLGDIAMLAKYRDQAAVLDKNLVDAMEKIDRINEEEKAYDWEESQYPTRKETHDLLTPYKKLFDAGQGFIEHRHLWLNSQVGHFDPEEIELEIGTTYRNVLKLDRGFTDKPVTKKLCEEVSPNAFLLLFHLCPINSSL